jgi:hypothetical protein
MRPWWEDDRGWDEDDGWGAFPRRRRSKVLQWTGIVVAGALVLASASSFIGVVLGGSSPTTLPVRDVQVTPATGGGHAVDVTFVVSNPTGSTVAPVCTALVVQGTRALWAVDRVEVRGLAAGATAERGFRATVPSALPDGSRAEVSCRA